MRQVIITRPINQSIQLIEKLGRLDLDIISFPTIEIVQRLDNRYLLDKVNDYDMVIFTSSNAVRSILPHLSVSDFTPTIATIGPATRTTCQQSGLSVSLCPNKHFNSDALLALPEFNTVSGKQILIITGENGRTLLADTLTARGANTQVLTCYYRQQPEYSNQASSWVGTDIDLIVCTSNTSIENLTKMLPKKEHAWLRSQQLLVVSNRAVMLAKDLGFTKTPILSASATDDDIVDTIKVWK